MFHSRRIETGTREGSSVTEGVPGFLSARRGSQDRAADANGTAGAVSPPAIQVQTPALAHGPSGPLVPGGAPFVSELRERYNKHASDDLADAFHHSPIPLRDLCTLSHLTDTVTQPNQHR